MPRRSADDYTFDPSLANFRTWLVPTSSVVDLLTVSHAQERIEEFREAMIRGDSFPPISGIRLGRRIFVADGHKRFSAYRELGRSHLHVEIWPLRRWLLDQGRQLRKTGSRLVTALLEVSRGGVASREARDLFGGIVRHYKRIAASLLELARRQSKPARKQLWQMARVCSDPVVGLLLSVAARVATHLPRPFIARLGSTLGLLAYHLLRGHRQTSLQNLEATLGTRFDARQRGRIAKASFSNLMRTSTLLLGSRRLADGGIQDFIDYDPGFLEHFLSTYRRGRGLITCCIHFGDWELLGQIGGLLGVPLVIEPCAGEGEVSVLRRNSRVEQLLWSLRATTGNRMAESVSELVSIVAQGRAACCLVDLNGSSRLPGDWIDFMGLASYTKNSVGKIASRTRAPILFCWCLPQSGGRSLFGGVEVDYPANATPSEISRLCLQTAEQLVEQYPELWLWCYRKWRRRPTPALAGYPAYSKYRELGDRRPKTNPVSGSVSSRRVRSQSSASNRLDGRSGARRFGVRQRSS